MTTWAKIKFYYASLIEQSGVTASAGTTATGYDVNNLAQPFEGTLWQATDALDVSITWDAGAGNSFPADYLALARHNLFTATAQVALQWSLDGVNWTTVVSAYAPSTDNIQLNEFVSPGPQRFWRINLTGLTAAPYIGIVKLGLKTMLDYASTGFDPYHQKTHANVGVSNSGYVTGIHESYTERRLSIQFVDADATLYALVKTWWETNGLNNFFVAWDYANNPTEVFLMRSEPQFNNPFRVGGAYRDININLLGRKE